MSVRLEPTIVPDSLDQAGAEFWSRHDLEEFMAGAEPFRADESFEIEDLTEEEWVAFERAIRE